MIKKYNMYSLLLLRCHWGTNLNDVSQKKLNLFLKIKNIYYFDIFLNKKYFEK